MMYVRFSAEGIPDCFSPLPVDGFEAVDTASMGDDPRAFLSAMRRRANGTWVKRAKPPAPTAEEREGARLAEREAERQARQEARAAARKQARLERLFDHMIDGLAKIDPGFAARVAAIDVEFGGED